MVTSKFKSVVRIEDLIKKDVDGIMEQLKQVTSTIDHQTKALNQLKWDQALLESFIAFNSGNPELAYHQLKIFMEQPEINVFMVTEYDVALYLTYLAKYAIAANRLQQASNLLSQAMTYSTFHGDSKIVQLISETFEQLQDLGIDEAQYKQFKISLSKKYNTYMHK